MTAVLDASFTACVGEGSGAFKVDAELALDRGVLVLFGPSGSGKSLCLQAIVGAVSPVRGHLTVLGETVFDVERGVEVAPHLRRIGYVPQHHSLFPFCSVRDNVAFGLPKAARRQVPREVEALIDEVGIGHLRDAMPESLSGGERQRVALARALAVRPRLLILDEPFASIDQQGKDELLAVLRSLLRRHELPALLVTHDPREAMSIGDAIVRFERGRTVGYDAPQSLRSLTSIAPI